VSKVKNSLSLYLQSFVRFQKLRLTKPKGELPLTSTSSPSCFLWEKNTVGYNVPKESLKPYSVNIKREGIFQACEHDLATQLTLTNLSAFLLKKRIISRRRLNAQGLVRSQARSSKIYGGKRKWH
jgi:hypothetical protein